MVMTFDGLDLHYDEMGHGGSKLRHMTHLRRTVAVGALTAALIPPQRRGEGLPVHLRAPLAALRLDRLRCDDRLAGHRQGRRLSS